MQIIAYTKYFGTSASIYYIINSVGGNTLQVTRVKIILIFLIIINNCASLLFFIAEEC